jgi:superfamily II DNA or RNA helicase
MHRGPGDSNPGHETVSMSDLILTPELLSRLAGWQAVKEAKALVADGRVANASWSPPRLEATVRDGPSPLRAVLVIHSAGAADNHCPCRQARFEGRICPHVVAAGLQVLAEAEAAARRATPAASLAAKTPSAKPARRLTRAAAGSDRPQVEVEPAQIHVVFPPNLAAALAQGRTMIAFEAAVAGKRRPLNALPLDEPFAFPPEDLALLDAIEALAGGDTPGFVQLPAPDFARLLPKLAGHPRLTLGKAQPLEVSTEPTPLPLRATLEPGGDIVLALAGAPPAVLVAGDSAWTLRDGALRPVFLAGAGTALLRSPVRFSRARVPAFLSQDWPRLEATGVEANFTLDDFTLDTAPPRFQLDLVGALVRLDAQLRCRYAGREVAPGVPGDNAFCLPDPARPTAYAVRDLAAEQQAVARLARSGFVGPDTQGGFRLDGEHAVLNFFAREYPRLQREWTLTLEERLQRATASRFERIEPKFAVVSSGEQWFDLSVNFASASGERFSAADIQRLVLAGASHTRLRNGRIALLDTDAVAEFHEVLRDCAPEQVGTGYRLDTAQAAFVGTTLEERCGWKGQTPARWRDQIRNASLGKPEDCPPLGALDGLLRPYQRAGIAWLRFLRKNGFGGILADEMGLGKTVQTLALLVSVRYPQGNPAQSCLSLPRVPAASTPARPAGAAGSNGSAGSAGASTPATVPPALVICPTSLVHNWADEAARFTPSIRTLILHGPDRLGRFPEIPRHDLVITSYALARRDAELYRDFEFDTVILDEAQHIKNRATQNAQAVKSIPARHRLVLTGTPLENSVLDLWSIFDFLMPAYLGSAADFRERYEMPITRDRDPAAQDRLGRRIRPFVLRRLKRDVVPELPSRIEQVAFCDLTSEQTAAYRQLLETGRQEVLSAVGAQGVAKSRMIVLTTLLRLRQACCDLRLLGLENVDEATASAKLDLFGELLDEAIDGGHRILVFSQFTRMLALIQQRLAGNAIDFCYLDGETRDRAGVVRRFQSQPDIPVFLISLKAGGTGLNLTGADTVVHFDPWWNPAVEAQATDRAHRIGQTRVVTSYKLIARNTVEEKILNLQSRKRAATQSILGDEAQLSEALSWDEIQELLAG